MNMCGIWRWDLLYTAVWLVIGVAGVIPCMA